MWRKAILFLSCALLAGCSKSSLRLSPSEVSALPPNLSYFASDQCQAPCWRGITPGTTDKASAEKIVYGFIHSGVVGRNGTFFNGYNEVGYSIDLSYYGDKVRLISILPSENKPRFEGLLDLLGNPDRVCLFLSEMPDSVPKYETDLVYLKLGIWLSSDAEFTEMDGKGKLKPSMDINNIVFFNPREKFSSLAGNRTAEIVQYGRKWKGYTPYDFQPLFFNQPE